MGSISLALMLVLGIFQLAVFQAGLHEWLGFHMLLSIFIGGFALMMGPLGRLAVAVVGFYAAMYAWNWAWSRAGLLCFPSIVLLIMVTIAGGTASLSSMLLNWRQS